MQKDFWFVVRGVCVRPTDRICHGYIAVGCFMRCSRSCCIVGTKGSRLSKMHMKPMGFFLLLVAGVITVCPFWMEVLGRKLG